MDRFTRNYSIGLGVITLVVVGFWLATFSFRVSELNSLLEEDKMLADYPYQFRVKSFKEGETELTTPRSAEVPAVLFLSIIYPELKGKSTEDPLLIAAQQDLAKHQAHAKKIIMGQADVVNIQWVLDLDWYSNQGIFFN